jgi:hypothetical protein
MDNGHMEKTPNKKKGRPATFPDELGDSIDRTRAFPVRIHALLSVYWVRILLGLIETNEEFSKLIYETLWKFILDNGLEVKPLTEKRSPKAPKRKKIEK